MSIRARRVLVRARSAPTSTSARDAGVNLAFFSGNEVFWKTRWEQHRRLAPTARSSPTRRRTRTPTSTRCRAVDGHAGATRGRSTPTGRVRRTRLTGHASSSVNDGTPAHPGPGHLPQHAASGVHRRRDARQAVATLAAGTLGYEWDSDTDNGSRPPGLVDLSATTVTGRPRPVAARTTARPTTRRHRDPHLTLYRAPSGALVFGAGTVQWSWGLDPTTTTARPAEVSRTMQQATLNLFADMHAQPATLQSDLVARL